MAMNTRVFPTQQLPTQQAPIVTPTAGIPSATWSMLSNQVRTEKLPRNLDAVFDMGKGYLARLKYRTRNYLARARKVLSYDKTFAKMSDADLRAAALEYRAMFRTGRDKPRDMLRAMAVIREVAS